jgi:formylglycine-generating enzyme required for sulfatase activity
MIRLCFFANFIAAILTAGPAGNAISQETKTPGNNAIAIPEADASKEDQMKRYVELIEHSQAKIEMLPIPGGTFKMGSPDTQADRKADEGPVREVKIDPFWMAKCEITWDAYDVWMSDLDVFYREVNKIQATQRDQLAD